MKSTLRTAYCPAVTTNRWDGLQPKENREKTKKKKLIDNNGIAHRFFSTCHLENSTFSIQFKQFKLSLRIEYQMKWNQWKKVRFWNGKPICHAWESIQRCAASEIGHKEAENDHKFDFHFQKFSLWLLWTSKTVILTFSSFKFEMNKTMCDSKWWQLE